MNIKKLLLFSLSVLVVLYGCTEDQSLATKDERCKFTISIVDSIVIEHARPLKFLDYSPQKKTFLFADLSGRITIMECDMAGKILNKFSVGGNDQDDIGVQLAAAAYIQTLGIGLVTERGIYIFSAEGEIQQQYEYKSIIKFPETIYRDIFSFQKDSSLQLLYSCDPFYDMQKETIIPGTPESNRKYYDRFRALTWYNTQNNEKELVIRFEENSIFKQEPNKRYFDLLPCFYANAEKLFVLFNPDPKVFIYDMSGGLEKVGQVDLTTDYFKYFSADETKQDMYKSLALNSRFRNVVVNDQQILVFYSTGIPEDSYPRSGVNLTELNGLSASYQKLYCSIYQNGVKVGKDVELPREIASVVHHIDENKFLAIPHAGRVEKAGHELFYICSLTDI